MIPRPNDNPPPLFAPPVDPNVRPQDKPRLTGQNAKLLSMLRRGPVNAMQAHEAGMMRLAARIHDLKAAGYTIESRWIGNVAEYRLVDAVKVDSPENTR